MSRSWLGGDRGSVAAEFAIAMTAVALVLLVAVGALQATGRQIALQDAVADAARLASRGESADRVQAAVHGAVAGATVGVEDSADLVCVSASAAGPLGLSLQARSCALAGGW